MKSPTPARLAFPCDCISSTPACQEPWALVAKEGMFKDGTKEDLLNILARGPKTIAQLAKSTRLAPPTIFRHVADLLRHRLVRETEPASREYAFEKYYKANFPVFTRADQKLFAEEIDILSREIADAVRRRLPQLRKRFADSTVASEGWAFEEAAQYMVHAAQREARRALEKEEELAPRFERGGLEFAFWGTE